MHCRRPASSRLSSRAAGRRASTPRSLPSGAVRLAGEDLGLVPGRGLLPSSTGGVAPLAVDALADRRADCGETEADRTAPGQRGGDACGPGPSPNLGRAVGCWRAGTRSAGLLEAEGMDRVALLRPRANVIRHRCATDGTPRSLHAHASSVPASTDSCCRHLRGPTRGASGTVAEADQRCASSGPMPDRV